MKKIKEWVKPIIVMGVTLFIAAFLIEEFSYQQKISDEFYSSAIPNDPVKLGMRPYDVKAVLGDPEETYIEKDLFQIGFAGNDAEWRETGEIMLGYKMRILDEAVTIEYQYNKRENTIWQINARGIGYYKTLDEAIAIVDKLATYAEMVFEQKGDYTFDEMKGSVSRLTYRFRAENQSDTFMYEISMTDVNAIYDWDYDNSYRVSIWQSLFQR